MFGFALLVKSSEQHYIYSLC